MHEVTESNTATLPIFWWDASLSQVPIPTELFVLIIIFNLENIYYFPSCSGGSISLLHFLLDIWKPGAGELSVWKDMECLWEILNLIPMRDLCVHCLSFIIPLNDATWNGIGSTTSYCLKCLAISSKFLFSYLILCITQWTFTKQKFDLDKMQSFLEVLKTFKFAAILVHHSHQSSLGFEWVVTYIKEHVISGLTHLTCFTFVNLT